MTKKPPAESGDAMCRKRGKAKYDGMYMKHPSRNICRCEN